MSHAAGCAQRCAQCGEDTYQNLNHHLPCFFLHNLFVFCHTEITEIHRNLNLCRGNQRIYRSTNVSVISVNFCVT